jgi:hypothetical protein
VTVKSDAVVGPHPNAFRAPEGTEFTPMGRGRGHGDGDGTMTGTLDVSPSTPEEDRPAGGPKKKKTKKTSSGRAVATTRS